MKTGTDSGGSALGFKAFYAAYRLRRHLLVRRYLKRRSAIRAPSNLVVSLTSYPPRYPTLHLVIESLIAQDVAIPKIVLYIAEDQAASLPKTVTAMTGAGFEIRYVDNIYSFKKLLPALSDFPGSPIITVDDDNIYAYDFVRTMLAGMDRHPGAVVCLRAHRVEEARDGSLSPYVDWAFDVQDERARTPSKDLLATGLGGIAYPPGILSEHATDAGRALRLCPKGDDLWFYWMARLNGSSVVKVGGRFVPYFVGQTQDETLMQHNLDGGGNDAQIDAMIEEFGNPLHL